MTFRSTGDIKFIPGYLQFCVKKHFSIHWQEYYDEAKSAAALADLVILGMKKAATTSGSERQVETLAQVHRALKADHQAKKKKTSKPVGDQLSLF